MRSTTTGALAAIAALPLAFLAAAPASAAVGEVTAVFTTAPTPSDGLNTVTGTFTFTGGAQPEFCRFYLMEDSSGFGMPGVIEPDATSATITAPEVADGTYMVEWYCDGDPNSGTDPDPYWGTPGQVLIGNPPTAEVQTLVVPSGGSEEPGTPEPGCTGSVCLPTGSFGF